MSDRHDTVELVPDTTVTHLTTAVLVAALTAVLAQVSIPVPWVPVPFSLQPFGPFLAGLLLGPLWGGFGMALYLVAGVAGAPVFSNGATGLGYVLGPTGGFLVGFLFGAIFVGLIAHRRLAPRDPRTLSAPVQAVALIAGIAVIYAGGIPWFASVQGISLPSAAGVLAPFLGPDLLKAALTVGILAGSGETLARLPQG